MDYRDIGEWLRREIFEKGFEDSEKLAEIVREFLRDTTKLHRLPDAITACFQLEEFPRVAEILTKALKTLDPYQVEIPDLIECFRKQYSFRSNQFAVFLERAWHDS